MSIITLLRSGKPALLAKSFGADRYNKVYAVQSCCTVQNNCLRGSATLYLIDKLCQMSCLFSDYLLARVAGNEHPRYLK